MTLENSQNSRIEIKDKSFIKEGVDFVYEQNNELNLIGAKEQYSEYLDNIFPESKIKDIVWHVSDSNFDKFDLDKIKQIHQGFGIYFSPKAINDGSQFTYPSVVELKRPLEVSSISSKFKDEKELNDLFERTYDILDLGRFVKKEEISEEEKSEIVIRLLLGATNETLEEYKQNYKAFENFDSIATYIKKMKEFTGKDGILEYNSNFDHIVEYIVFEPDQIHILGSKEDIEKFKEFVAQKKD